jgi:hypothetical protein
MVGRAAPLYLLSERDKFDGHEVKELEFHIHCLYEWYEDILENFDFLRLNAYITRLLDTYL